ncbi:hypothetical protein ACTAZI_11675, partial [Legionella bozemanae]|uniref:hypothetical protein n=1 Tax=Legionella bozemanae TaxID=447 RepID=UPI003EEBFA70
MKKIISILLLTAAFSSVYALSPISTIVLSSGDGTGASTGTNTGTDTGTNTGTDTGTNTGTDTGTNTGTDT